MEPGEPEDGHHGVADELLDHAAVALELVAHRVEVARHHLAQRLRVERLAEARRPLEVGEDDRHDLARLLRRGRVGELRAAGEAEPRDVGVLGAAARAGLHAASLRTGRRIACENGDVSVDACVRASRACRRARAPRRGGRRGSSRRSASSPSEREPIRARAAEIQRGARSDPRRARRDRRSSPRRPRRRRRVRALELAAGRGPRGRARREAPSEGRRARPRQAGVVDRARSARGCGGAARAARGLEARAPRRRSESLRQEAEALRGLRRTSRRRSERWRA